jgi:polysaccharide export outer membrane protein
MKIFFRLLLWAPLVLAIPDGISRAQDPNQSAASSGDQDRYKVRPGDTLELQYHMTPDLNQTVVVQPDGYVSLNVAGEVKVAGYTVPEASTLIKRAAALRLNQPELNLILKEFTHPTVVVAGAVYRPGQIELKEPTTALGAVLLAGGFVELSRSGQVWVFRKVNEELAEVIKLNLTGIKKSVDLKRDLALQAGDMIYVPRDKLSTIERYVRLVNTGAYFNPLQNVH